MMPIDITAVAAACSAATPGPWRDSSGKGSGSVSAAAAKCAIYINVRRHEDEYSDETVARWQADAAFIALARTALPDAIAEIQRLRALVEEAFREGFMLAEDHAEVSEDDGWHRCAPHIDWTIANREFDKRKEEIRNAAKGTP